MEHFLCSQCEYRSTNFLKLLNHYRYIHNGPRSLITCNLQGCQRVFRNVRSFQVHVKKKHPAFWERYGRVAHVVELEDEELSEVSGGDEEVAGDILPNELADVPIDTDQAASSFILGLREQFKVCDQICSHVADEVEGLIEQAREQLNERAKAVLPQVGNDELEEIFSPSEMEQSFNFFRKTSQLNTYVKNNFDFVEPVEYVMGRRNNKVQCVQYVSVLKTLQALLKKDDIFAEVIQGHQSQGFIQDYCDGSFCKDNQLFSQIHPAIQVQLYHDDFTVANPIGNRVKQLKFSAFYFCLGNIPPEFRSKLSCIQLAMLCPSTVLADCGMSQVLAPFIEEMKHLESVGLYVEKDGSVYNLKGSLSMVVADNLAAHGIGGFQESFNTERLCRYCMITKNTMKDHFRDTDLVLRRKDSYNQQAELATQMPDVARVYGIKRESPLNQLEHFHVIHGLPPDIAHDFFEGIVPDVIDKVIRHCVGEEYFTLEFLNEQVENFPYHGTDKTNKPSKMATQLGKFKVKQKAVQAWCFLRLLPLMVGDRVPVDDRVWAVLLLLEDVLQVCTSYQVDIPLSEFLADLIETFLDSYFREFPDVSMKPKFHYIVHYPKLMLKFGPLIHCWTLRFEGKHLYFKELSYRSKNRRNMCKTLAMRHEYYQAWMRTKTTFLMQDMVDHTCSQLVPVRILLRSIQTLIQPLVNGESVYTAKKLQYAGTWYCRGLAVALGFTQEGFVEFGVIEMCCLIDGTVYLVCQHAGNTEYIHHIHGYAFTLTDKFSLKQVSDLVDHYPLGVYHSNMGKVVVLRHHITCPV